MARPRFMAAGLFAAALAPAAGLAAQTDQERNKAVVRALVEEALNDGDFSNLDHYLHPDLFEHDPHQQAAETPKDAFIAAVQRFDEAFPDGVTTIEDQLAENDRVATRWKMSATHRGDFMGVPPTCARVEMAGMFFDRLSDGKLIETWAVMDLLSLRQQLETARHEGKTCADEN